MIYSSEVHNIKDIFNINFSFQEVKNKISYTVPLNQREFVWDEEKIDRLIQDIKIAFDDKEEYFLGGIVLSIEALNHIENTIDIIDGQQRITTISIILATIYNYAILKRKEFNSNYENQKLLDVFYRETISKDLKNLIFEEKIVNDNVENIYKLNTSEQFKLFYENLISQLINSEFEAETIIDLLKKEAKEHKALDNMLLVSKLTIDFLNSEIESFDILRSYIDFLLTKISIIVTVTKNIHSAFKVFETLNDRGMKLLPEDLIKNFILKNVKGDEYKDYVNKWSRFIENLKVSPNSSNFIFKPADFFNLYYLSKGVIYKKDRLFYKFQEEEKSVLGSNKNIQKFLDELIQKSNFLVEQKKSLYSLNKIDFGLGYSIVLNLFEFKDTKEFSEAVKQIDRLGFVWLITKHKSIKDDLAKLNRALNEYLNSQKDESISMFLINYINSILLPQRDDFKERLTILKVPYSGKLYNQMKYMFTTIAEKLDDTKYNLLSKDTHIEHIMPKTNPNQNCFNDFNSEEYNSYKQKIGNLTILNQKLNSSLKNHCLAEKIEKIENNQKQLITSSIFEDIKFNNNLHQKYRKTFNYKRRENKQLELKKENITIEDLNEWTKVDIDYRTKCLVNLAIFIWIENNL